jgi:hypothetical protein
MVTARAYRTEARQIKTIKDPGWRACSRRPPWAAGCSSWGLTEARKEGWLVRIGLGPLAFAILLALTACGSGSAVSVPADIPANFNSILSGLKSAVTETQNDLGVSIRMRSRVRQIRLAPALTLSRMLIMM